MINGSSNACYKCGKKGHFVNSCYNISEDESSESEEEFEVKKITQIIMI